MCQAQEWGLGTQNKTGAVSALKDFLLRAVERKENIEARHSKYCRIGTVKEIKGAGEFGGGSLHSDTCRGTLGSVPAVTRPQLPRSLFLLGVTALRCVSRSGSFASCILWRSGDANPGLHLW